MSGLTDMTGQPGGPPTIEQVGEDNDRVLATWLGYGGERIDALRARQVI